MTYFWVIFPAFGLLIRGIVGYGMKRQASTGMIRAGASGGIAGNTADGAARAAMRRR